MSSEFVLQAQAALGLRGRNLDIVESDDVYVLRGKGIMGLFWGAKIGL